jgi:ABC-2 type transport system ATP-binding protein
VITRADVESLDGSLPVRVEDFGRRYRSNRPWAVRRVSFSLPPHSITAFVGPNGAGKSTLIRACLGFERSDEGRVLVFGSDPVRDPARAIGAIGYVPQHLGLYSDLTISDHFAIAVAARRTFDATGAALHLGQIGLGAERRISELSGGEQAALSLALGTRAPLLLLDEPLAGLDPLARREFLDRLVTEVRSRGATALLSSHIVSDVEEACDRLVVLARGQLVLDTAVAEAKQHFRTVPQAEWGDASLVGSFTGAGGERVALITSQAAGRSASLEEIVLGHLAIGRGSSERAS